MLRNDTKNNTIEYLDAKSQVKEVWRGISLSDCFWKRPTVRGAFYHFWLCSCPQNKRHFFLQLLYKSFKFSKQNSKTKTNSF